MFIFQFQCAWLGIIRTVALGIVIVLLVVSTIVALAALNNSYRDIDKGIIITMLVIGFIFTGICVADFILTVSILVSSIDAICILFILQVITVKFAFKLARLIDATKHVTTQQI